MAAGTALIALEPPGHRQAHARGLGNADTGTSQASGPSPEQPDTADRCRTTPGTQAGRDLSGTRLHYAT
jgi:hypothetical protein